MMLTIVHLIVNYLKHKTDTVGTDMNRQQLRVLSPAVTGWKNE